VVPVVVPFQQRSDKDAAVFHFRTRPITTITEYTQRKEAVFSWQSLSDIDDLSIISPS
jgi:hypothetical protein